MEDYENIFKGKVEPLLLQFADAKNLLMAGLRHFIGDDAQWLQGYDDIAQWMADNQRKGLLLSGTNGRGKSVICRDILPMLVEHFYRSVRIFISRGCELRSVVNDHDWYMKLLCARVVFIDDFGTETLASIYGEKHDVFSEIVDLAEQERQILIATTNMGYDEIGERYGVRTLDRLKSLTRAYSLYGDSMRK